MVEYTRNDRVLNEHQVNRLLKRAVAEVGGVDGDWRCYNGGEEPSHVPGTNQRNPNAGQPRPGYLRLVATAEGVTAGQIAALVDGWTTMPLAVDEPLIAADEVDTATISLVYSEFDGDTAVNFEMFLDGESIQTGTRAVTGDTMTPVSFNTDTPGTYEIEVRRQTGYQSGIVTIIATEA